jgi:hypothetical protein
LSLRGVVSPSLLIHGVVGLDRVGEYARSPHLFRTLQDREVEDASKDRTLVEANILMKAYNSMS